MNYVEFYTLIILFLVFKVHLENDKSKEYALKVEKKIETRKHSKLKMEVSFRLRTLFDFLFQIAILKLVSALRAERSHFTKIIDRGKCMFGDF